MRKPLTLLALLLSLWLSGCAAASAPEPGLSADPVPSASPVTDTWALRLAPGVAPKPLAMLLSAEYLGPVGLLPDTYLFRFAGSAREPGPVEQRLRARPEVQWWEQQVTRRLHPREPAR